jgi:hypothetical protein
MFLMIGLKSVAETKVDTMFNATRKWKVGIVLGSSAAIWKQNNINGLLSGNNVGGVHFPTLSDLSLMGTFGLVFQHNKYRFVYGFDYISKKPKNDLYKMEERLGAVYLNVQYAAYRTKPLAISPEIGLGMMSKRLDIYNNAVPINLVSVVTSGNAVNLFAHLYYLNFGLNFGLAYDKDMRDHWLQLVVGYKYCFAGTDWSTSSTEQTLSVSNHDNLRMAYVGLRLNSLRIR